VTGLQNDNSWKINAAHTLRTGFTVQNDHVQADSNSLAFQTDANGTPLTDGNGNNILTPHIIENHASDSQLYGLYLQDEWKITDTLTMNYGARFDDMEADVSANQLSPRIGLVYKATDTTTLHAGYARTFTPPPQELVANEDISQFANTTNAAQVTLNDPVKPERTHSFDAGVTQKIGNHWEVGLDGYYKLAHDLLDEGQFGQALILTPFNYEHGYIYGSELTATYTGDRLKAYANFAASRAMGENVVSAEFKFTDPTEFDYIKNHFVHLDHDQTYTASAGMTYDVSRDTTVGLDGREGSGLRSGFANLSHLPAYATLDTSVEQRLNLFPHDQTAVKLSVINLFDTPYELRSGTGIGVGAPQWGARRGVFATLTQKF
ncbi:MAG: TonB-dependent receptor, partial [Alphaproteobacteria bacterium]|nr:TonB-dependent receptor [Alphaproteobacteria bacterium]